MPMAAVVLFFRANAQVKVHTLSEAVRPHLGSVILMILRFVDPFS